MLNFFSRFKNNKPQEKKINFCWKRINFEKYDLIICEINKIVEYKIMDYGTRHTWWDYQDYTRWIILPEFRILVRYEDNYYEPSTFDGYYSSNHYQGNHDGLGVGDKFVKEIEPIPIQYHELGKHLTEMEKKNKKITIDRIKELENILNSANSD